MKKKTFGKESTVKKKDVKHVKSVYDIHDPEGTGVVNTEKFLETMKKDYNMPEEVCKLFRNMDIDNSGTLSFEEFLKGYYPDKSSGDIRIMYEWAYPPTKAAKIKEEEETATAEDHKVSSRLSKDQLDEIANIFKLYDMDGNGVLDRCELINALTKTGYDEDEVTDLFEGADSDGSNQIDMEEFIGLLESSFA